MRISPLLCSVKALSCIYFKTKMPLELLCHKNIFSERNFYPYYSRHSHPCNGIFLPYFSQQIFPCRRNRSVSADFPCLHTCLCCNFSRDRDGSGAPGCRLFCKKAVCKSLFLPESSTALFSFSFHLLSFSVAEKCCFPHHSHTW